MHLTLGVFGDNELLKNLGKQGTVNDIMIYNHASSEGVFTFVAPNSERVQPLLQAIAMTDVPVISGELTKEVAEQIVALDAFGFGKGFLVGEHFQKFVKGTSLENFGIVSDEKELREKIKSLEAPELTKNVWAPVDNYFNVKSVGTVVLTVLKGGAIKKYDKLLVQPIGKEAVVKGIQSQDNDIDEAQHGMRLGLNLKGVEADDLKRGYVICKEANVSKTLKIEFKKSIFAKEGIETGSNVLVSVGLQVIAAKAEANGAEITLTLEHPAAYFPGQKCIIASTKQTLPRIIGSGKIS